MKFENTTYFKTHSTKIEKPYGNFYLLDSFFISEIHEGVHFSWQMIKETMDEIVSYYEKDVKLGYISNRINSYSMNPESWNKVDETYGVIVAGAVVTYNKMTYMNATLEKRFYKKSIKRCTTLNEAINWILNLKELN
ncbi:hypothetical protein [uncultured Algibacter sp.]|uniref:hypothetical protein n=1 Tax=uncultured Algibacter sp. TaxID=298659 RepID=UPI002627924D|nr:hypothetical protein [uncultured Algibacter sp.]